MGIANAYEVRRQIVERILSDPEVERVSRQEGDRRLIEGDEFVDLDHVELGVQQCHEGRSVNASTVVPRCAVSDDTWSKIINVIGQMPA